MKKVSFARATLTGLTAICATGIASAQVVKYTGPSPNIPASAVDFDSPFVASGPLNPAIFAGTGITSVTQMGTWTAAGDLMSTGLHNGQNLVSQGGAATVVGNGESLDNPGAGAGWDIVLDMAVDEFQCAFTDQSNFSYDIELLLGGASLGVANLTYTEGAPDLVYFRATGSQFDQIVVTFPTGSGGLGIDDLGFGFGPGPMPPANDECMTADAVGTGTTAFNTTFATLSAEAWSCAGGGGPDVWFTYTAQANFALRIETCGSSYDTGIVVYEGACGALTEIVCNDDDCGLQSGADIVPVAGTTYTIRVGGFSGAVGTGDLTITEDLFAPGDDCSVAIPVGAGVTPFDTTLMSASSPFACAAGGGPDTWFAYTSTNGLPVTFETCGASYDTALEIFSGSCGSLSLIQCNDDAMCGGTFSLQSRVSASAPIGETLYVRVGGFNGATGAGDLTVIETPLPDNCVETLFASNNGGAVGGAVYFDATFTQDVVISGISSNYSAAAGTVVGVDVYVTPGTRVGVETTPGAWMLVGSGNGVSAGTDVPTLMNTTSPIAVPAGSYGIALVAVGSAHRYTNGNGANEMAASNDGVIALTLGAGSNVPFTGGIFMPRVWNGSFCYDLPLGTNYCGPAVPNSTGNPGTIAASGSAFIAYDTLTLTASDLPANSFGYFLCSPTAGFIPNPGGSTGNLCLDGFIGRGVGWAILLSDAGGVAQVTSDLEMPTPILVRRQIEPGETFHFQFWHRDSNGMGGTTSNFTDAISVTYQ